ncbi:MAG TPA: c-type cytochrome [Methylibium sp.]|uniref:c-type cytochrome n=1 Tax=Methylibium sp. TaxID=2067992 RepID=UPI002DBC18FF|nr:c-type cytochrome [Methylibium sp.]HEU4459600.1 c-type cytochrome [Methylibium sp.]
MDSSPGVVAALLALAALAVPAAAQDAKALATRSLAATCANCHGTDGKAVPGESMARLAGLDAAYFTEQMKAFRDGRRPATVMHQLTKGYSEEQIAALAAYFAAQK